MNDNMNALLWHMMQGMQGGSNAQGMYPPPEAHENAEAFRDGPIATLIAIRPMMPERQQRLIDVLIKMQEIRAIFEEM